jgi:hypothetical protein
MSPEAAAFAEIYSKLGILFPVDKDEIMANFKSRLPELTGRSPSTDLEFAQVRTYRQPETVAGASTVPSVLSPIASHWGIVVGGTLYHLTIQGHQGADGSGSPPEDHKIEFLGVSPAKDKIKESKVVGQTKYDHNQLMEIAAVLMESFTNHHYLCWNRQVFAECFLNIITDGGSFEEYDADCLMLIH